MHDFDALAADAANVQNKLGERAFVEAALSLEAWFVIGLAPDDAPNDPEPMVVGGVDGPRLLVFTDEDRAAGYAKHLSEKGAAGGKVSGVLHMDVDDAVGYCDMLRLHDVGWVHFNDGDHALPVAIVRVVELGKKSH